MCTCDILFVRLFASTLTQRGLTSASSFTGKAGYAIFLLSSVFFLLSSFFFLLSSFFFLLSSFFFLLSSFFFLSWSRQQTVLRQAHWLADLLASLQLRSAHTTL